MGRGRGRGSGGGGRGGRGNEKRFLRRQFKEKRDDVWNQDKDGGRGRHGDDGRVTAAAMENAGFEAYYKAQGIVPEEEWGAFMDALRRPLPLTFRINGSGHHAAALRDRLKSDFISHFTSGPVEVGGDVLDPPRPLPWYPLELAWQMELSRRQLRKTETLESVHEFMKLQNDAGGITRQEAVSMVPPLFLEVEPHHRVLDMCAAPGSKTVQILEALHSGNEAIPQGFVIANDADAKRCNLLTHQTKRLCSPCMVITNHEAQSFPIVSHPVTKTRLGFHRILCDVPCSGDGTLRKNADIWRKWSARNGNSLHLLQLRIALQGCRLLEMGGRLVYSTCSFNPVEDEAVVAEVLRRCGGGMRLVDVGGDLPALRRSAGLHKWVVRHEGGGAPPLHLASFDEAEGAEGARLVPSMFPAGDEAELHLERCMRFLPHHSDTGGFFVAVLEKVGDCGRVPFPESWAALDKRKRRRSEGAKESGGAEGSTSPPTKRSHDGDEAAAKDADAGGQGGAGEGDEAGAVGDADVEGGVGAAGVEGEGEGGEGAVAEEGAGEGLGVAAAGAAAPALGGAADASAGVGLGEADPLPGPRGGGGRAREGTAGRHRALDPILPVTGAGVVESISDFYGLSGMQHLRALLVTRSDANDKPKKIYYITPQVKHLLAVDVRESLKVTALGVKVFERQKNKGAGCDFRLSQEGLPLLVPHLTKQTVRPTVREFRGLLELRGLRMGASQDGRTTLSDARTTQELDACLPGCLVAMLRDEDAARLGLPTGMEGAHGELSQAPLAVACYKGQVTVNVLVGMQEGKAMLQRLMDHLRKHGTEEELRPFEASARGEGAEEGAEAKGEEGEGEGDVMEGEEGEGEAMAEAGAE